jgi:hypothetical protein
MILSMHQPNFLPWLGFFDKMLKSDIFVILDEVQVPQGRSCASRCRIKTQHGPRRISLPIHKKKLPYNQTMIACLPSWVTSTTKTLRHNYSRSPHCGYNDFFPTFSESTMARSLLGCNLPLILWAVLSLGIDTEIKLQSVDSETRSGKKSLAVDLCKEFNCDTYLSGAGARSYNDSERFEQAGIKLRYQDFFHPVYKQAHGGFIPNMSILDLIFNHGPNSLQILKGENMTKCAVCEKEIREQDIQSGKAIHNALIGWIHPECADGEEAAYKAAGGK